MCNDVLSFGPVNCIDVQLHIAVLHLFLVKYSGKQHGAGEIMRIVI